MYVSRLEGATSAILGDVFQQSIDAVVAFANAHWNRSKSPEYEVLEWIPELTGSPDTSQGKFRYEMDEFEVPGNQFFQSIIRRCNGRIWEGRIFHQRINTFSSKIK